MDDRLASISAQLTSELRLKTDLEVQLSQARQRVQVHNKFLAQLDLDEESGWLLLLLWRSCLFEFAGSEEARAAGGRGVGAPPGGSDPTARPRCGAGEGVALLVHHHSQCVAEPEVPVDTTT